MELGRHLWYFLIYFYFIFLNVQTAAGSCLLVLVGKVGSLTADPILCASILMSQPGNALLRERSGRQLSSFFSVAGEKKFEEKVKLTLGTPRK